jgi:hypothetical protein
MPLPSTMIPIATNTLTTSTASVTFSSIPQGYTDLVLVINATSNVANAPTLQFNGDTGSNYSSTAVIGNGSAASSNRTSNQSVIYYGGWINGFSSTASGNAIIHIMNYSNTTTNKTTLNRFNVASIEVDAVVGLWRNTAAITSITLSISGGATYSSSSTFTLYGVKAA